MARTSTSVRNPERLLSCLLWSSKRLLLIAAVLSLGALFRVIQDCSNLLYLSRLHQVIYSNISAHNPSAPRILVAFTGPSEPKHMEKTQLYMRNTDHFLKYGVQCHDSDTLITVSEEYYKHYYPKVKAIRDSQCTNGHFVHLVSRRKFCYDMETVRMIVSGGIAGVNWNEYDYFVHINCGVTGPHPQFQHTWLQIYLSKLKSPVHMTGLSLNCDHGAHVQSMLYAVDRIGMDLIQSIPYDCTVDRNGQPRQLLEGDLYWQVVGSYEVGLSRDVLKNGHAIAAATLQSGIVLTQNTACNFTDIWYPNDGKRQFGGQLPSWNETIFWKSSRFMTPEIQNTIGYTGKIDFTNQLVAGD